MKKIINIAFFSSVLFTSACGNSSSDYKGYACPMECEGDSIHKTQGKCSVCEMELEGVEK